MACSDSKDIVLVLVGDSDISRWPTSEITSLFDYPILKDHQFKQPILSNYSKSGALLQNVTSQVAKALKDLNGSTINSKKSQTRSKKHYEKKQNQNHNQNHNGHDQQQHKHPSLFFIACAGENDLSSGFPVDTVINSFHKLVDSIFSESHCHGQPYLIFFGPKLEPWLNDNDNEEMRKLYYQLNERLAVASLECAKNVTMGHSLRQGRNHHCHSDGKNVYFIDSLTRFCGPSASEKGSVLSGKAKAETKYFDDDGLHLNENGYKVWKEELGSLLVRILCSERCNTSLNMSHGKKIILD